MLTVCRLISDFFSLIFSGYFSEPESESFCSDMADGKEKVFKLDKNLNLIVSYNRTSLKTVANLVMVINKMKMPPEADGCLSAILEHVVKETVVCNDQNTSSEERRVSFTRTDSMMEFKLADKSQKHIVHFPEEMKLRAITLKGGYCHLKANFTMSRYNPTSCNGNNGKTVLLSITKNLHLSCTKTDSEVVLNLEECCEEKLKEIKTDEDMDRFLFFKKIEGTSQWCFESVKYRGWFIKTSTEDTNPLVEMCQRDGDGCNKYFQGCQQRRL
ncbi:interleukin-1 beta isoform X1 [Oryzias melastigma]|uniref:interleukin-1 beta isoform X1 n=1 Tax=Oryzias melastigma TaxID=30732 RepID=UPI000CF80E03|nr:interleukin-1 beta isoform X1 [Oryzias melastigma]